MELNRRELAIANEAFMIGRIYAKNGEKEHPSEIYTKLENQCKLVADLETSTQKVGYAIKGTHGFYTGWWLSKKDAIRVHTKEKVSNWSECRKLGDRCVKVIITEK